MNGNSDPQRQQEGTARQTRIRDALADFYKKSLPALRAKRARQDVRQERLFPPSGTDLED
jgi:hypothetical protein